MATLKIVLDQRRKRANGTFPLVIRVTHQSKSRDIPLNIHLQQDEWDEEASTVRKNRANYKILNHKIKSKYVELEAGLLKLETEKSVFSIDQAKNLLTGRNKVVSFFQFGETWVERLRNAKMVGNAKTYANVLGRFRKYLKGKDITFTDINYEFLHDFEANMLASGIKINTISFYLRTIRTIYNKAIKAGHVDRSHYPFTDFSIKNEPTPKRAITKEKIKCIEHLELLENTELWNSRNYFILSFYLIGISFIDLAKMRYSDIKEGRLTYKRQKTGKLYNIKLTAKAMEILTHYHNEELARQNPNAYILPIIPEKAWGDVQKEYDFCLHGSRRCNIFLKQLAELCNIEENLTSYVARHSWATTAKKMGYSKDLVAEALGHEFGIR